MKINQDKQKSVINCTQMMSSHSRDINPNSVLSPDQGFMNKCGTHSETESAAGDPALSASCFQIGKQS